MVYFRLRDIYYAISDQLVTIHRNADNITLDVSLSGITNDKNKTDCLFNIKMNISVTNDSTNLYDFENKHIKLMDNDAGTITVIDKKNNSKSFNLDMSKIYFSNISNDDMIVHWSGEVSLPYNKKYGKCIPFDMEFKAKCK